uniref:Jacalin-type lectin domain-containing protein n=1 Tax=Oryza punctata TaxID=4537 RepID=A0A0E0MFV6_ORYPU
MEAAAVVSASTAALNTLLPKLADLLVAGEQHSLRGSKRAVKDGVEHLESELTSIRAALEKLSDAAAAPPDQLDVQVKLWARDVRDMSYDIEDAIDSYMLREAAVAGRRRRPPPPCCCCCVVGFTSSARRRRAIAAEIERIKKEVEEVRRRRERYKIDDDHVVVVDANAVDNTPVDRRLPALYTNATSLVGVDGSMDKVIKLLSMEGEDGLIRRKLKLVAIVGPGGIGKTTLANLVYQKLHGQFERQAFVSVSQKPNVKAVLSSILCQVSQLEHEKFSSWGEKEVIDKIRDVLKDTRYFIIVDDIWDKPTWQLLKCVLIDNDHGSKIITTTRNIDVAKLCCYSDDVDGTIQKLQPLSVADSEKLLYHKVFRNERCPPQLKDISQKILKRCGGLPLAIITIASLFANRQTQTEDHWNSVCNSFHTGLESSTDVKDMHWIISLSYCDLPSPLKTCFMYLSIFPEDYIIDRDDLIWRWIAEGFIQPRQGRSLYEKGENYFDELINRNLIQPICIDVHGKAQACRVHDTILEFIASLSIEENFVAILNGQCSLSDLPKKIYRLSLQNSKDDITIPDSTERFSHVRSLWQGIDLKMPLSSFRVLRVFDLGDCSSQNIDNIGNLVHLRYLRLRGTHYNKLPKEIGNLRFLQTLDIKQTRIKELPSTGVHLTQLMRLMVDTWTKLPNGIGNMECLEHLSEIDISVYPNLMKELRNLPNLRVLEILLSTWEQSKEKQFLDCLGSMKKLETLHIFAPDISLDFMFNIDWTLQELKKFTVCVRRESEDIFNLSPDTLSGWAEFSPCSILPRWINSSLTKLSYVSIIVKILQQEDLGVLGDLPALCSLDLSVIDALEERLMILGHSGGNGQAIAFQCLANFNFASPAMVLVFRHGAMQRLQMLSFRFQLKETKVFHSDLDMGLENLTSLKTVHFGIDCRYTRLWEVQAAEVALRNATNLNLNCPTLDLSKHFERLMYWDGMEEIPDMKIFIEENVGIVKIGPWGGNRGRRYDIQVAPHHLESIRVHSDMAVHSFQFEYSDRNGQKHVAGPWGGYGGSNVHTIQLESSEVLVAVSGTFGRFTGFQNVITSLTFVTNTHSYGPYGQREGTPFHIPVQCGGCIVGFFGRAGWCFDAIGIYVNPDLQTIKDKGKVVLAKIGPCGGNGGEACDIMVPPHHLESVTICSDIIQFGPSEFVTRVSGTIGSYNTPSDVVTSITLVTNVGCYGPFGQENGIPFDFPVQGNGSIVGFFGHADLYVDAIGVYVTPSMGTMKEEENVGLTKIGPFGRRGGNPFDIKIQLGPSEFFVKVLGTFGPFGEFPIVITSLTFVTNTHHQYGPFGQGGGTPFHAPMSGNGSIVGLFGREGSCIEAFGLDKIGPCGGNGGKAHDIMMLPHRLENVTICSDIVIHSLAFSYNDNDGQHHMAGPWGGDGGNNQTIQFGPSEFLTRVSGTIGSYNTSYDVITSITLGNGSIVGFFGHVELYVDSIGVYVNPWVGIWKQEEKEGIIKIGSFGRGGGHRCDIKVTPQHLESITISSKIVINSLTFSYRSHDGQQHILGPWGGGGNNYTINLGPLEFLTKVHGTFGPFGEFRIVITSLIIINNAGHQYGPFSQGGGTPFHAPIPGNGSIVGFFGHQGACLEAIGISLDFMLNVNRALQELILRQDDVGVLGDLPALCSLDYLQCMEVKGGRGQLG